MTQTSVDIALDHGAGIYARGTCTHLLRPPGYGRFHGIEFRLMATVDDDGVLRTVAMREIYCDWYPLVSGSG